MTVRLAVFDCDGTLVDGQAAVCDSMQAAFAESGLAEPDRADIRRIVGLSLAQAVRELSPEASWDVQSAVVEAYKTHFRATRESGALEEPLYEGIAALLHRLHEGGWALAVATGKSDRGLVACMEAHGLDHLFVSLQTADRHPSKPAPSMLLAALDDAGADRSDAVMIGDTSYDMAMAANAGVRGIGVGWGYHDADELFAAGARGVAHTIEQLERMIHGRA